MSGVVLSRQTGAEELRQYFETVQTLRRSGKEYPVDLDEVWPLVYNRKDYAVKALKSICVEGVDYQRLLQKAESGNGNKDVYYISVSAMEYIIARKVRAVFEVYRTVFHKTVSTEALPQSYPEALRRLAEKVEENERLAAKNALQLKELDESRQREQMLTDENTIQREQIKKMEPKAQYVDDVLQSTNTMTFTEVAKDLGYGSSTSLLKALRCANIVYRQGDKWIPFASLSREGYFSTRTARYFNSKGEPQSSTYTVVTQKGRWWLRKKFGLEQ